MRYRLLGSLEVSDRDRPLALGEGRQRSVLTLLLLHRNEAVSSDRLIDALWGERPPATAGKVLQNYVTQLRRALDDRGGQRLLTRGRSYVLEVADGELDVDRFELLVDEGSSALADDRAADAAALLGEALALWRGPPLADVAYEPFAQAEIARLEERHGAALEQRIDADLALGRHAELVAELEGLVAEHPLRERLRAQLMIALYRCGRQADALEAYGAARRVLLDGLGVEPGPGLRDLQAAILRQDPELAPAPTIWPRPRSVSPRRRALLAAGGALLVAAAVGAAVLTGGRGHQRGLPALARTDAVVAIDPVAARVTGAIGVGASPSHLAADGRTLWVTNVNGHSVSRIDAADSRLRPTPVTVGNGPAGLAVADGAVWVVNSLDGTVSKVTTATGKAVKEIRVGNDLSGICIGHGTVWVARSEDRAVTRIDQRSGRPTGTTPLATGPTELECGASAVWASSGAGGTVTRLNATTGAVRKTIHTDDGAGGLALAYGALWVANTLAGTVSKIDPESDRVVATIPLEPGDGPSDVAAGAGKVWVSNEFTGTVVAIDPRRNAAVSRVQVGYRPQGLALADGALWVGVRASGAGHRGGTLRVVTEQRFAAAHFVPGSYITFPWQILSLTNDGLTAFRRTGGPDGYGVVPDLALSLPQITDSGLTYAFQMRRGIRYSDGEPVLPADIRRGLVRVLRTRSGAAGLYTGIVGAARCVKRRAACDLSRGIVVDNAAATITFHLTAPDGAFLYKLALPAAIAVSRSDAGPVPSATGPYKIARIRPWRTLKLVRNPNFREWSAAAKPRGNVGAITVRFGVKAGAAVRAVEHGDADYLDSSAQLTPLQLGDVFTRFGAQVHPSPRLAFIGLFLNTRVPPFNDVDVRRAVNYAIDRRVAVELEGGALAAQPTCQPLPPHFPAYRSYCPYTDNGSAWGSPELAKARELVARSHTQGMHVTVWSSSPEAAADGRLAKQVLDELGYHASLHLMPLHKQVPYVLDPSHRAQIGTWGLGSADYPAASNILLLYSCRSGDPSQFCDRRSEQLSARALHTETTDQIRANALWTEAEHRIVDQAAMVPLFNPNAIDLVSPRVGDVQRNPELGVLLDQLWVR